MVSDITVEHVYDNTGKIVESNFKIPVFNDRMTTKEEEPIRNEIINILAKYNLPYWKAKLILERTTTFLDKEAVVQEVI